MFWKLRGQPHNCGGSTYIATLVWGGLYSGGQLSLVCEIIIMTD